MAGPGTTRSASAAAKNNKYVEKLGMLFATDRQPVDADCWAGLGTTKFQIVGDFGDVHEHLRNRQQFGISWFQGLPNNPHRRVDGRWRITCRVSRHICCSWQPRLRSWSSQDQPLFTS